MNIINKLRIYFEWLFKLFRSKSSTYKVTICDDLPVNMKEGVLYILGEVPYQWSVGFLCPCGCKATIQLNLLKGARPLWALTQHIDGTYSLRPSIWRKVGCKSHFFFERNQIRWVKDE
jgi:hypothetical protein